MLNIKSLCALMAVASLLLAALGIVRFGIDLWAYLHSSNPGNTPSGALNYGGLGVMLSGVVMFGIFILLYRWRKH
jgi:uncharacterized BrkB/YihY/UPF0761 family membrane protein